MGRRGFDELPTAVYETRISGVHEAPTQPAPYVDEPIGTVDLVGSIPVGDLYADFVPIVELRTGRTLGFEALPLCRTEGLTDPAELYARAIFEKRVGELGRVVRRYAVAECMGTPLYISVHPRELGDGWLVRPDDPICNHDAEIFLQVAQQTYSPIARQMLLELASRSGICLVLDDLGAGGSNVEQLVALAPRVVKLDAELIVGLARDKRKRWAVGHLTQLCQQLGARVVAKGLRCGEDLSAVLDCGIERGQGPILGAPAPLPTISAWPRP